VQHHLVEVVEFLDLHGADGVAQLVGDQRFQGTIGGILVRLALDGKILGRQ